VGVLAFETPPLAAPLAIVGTPRVRLDLTLSGGCDAAVFAYLEDVSPCGGAAYVSEGCQRAAFAASAATAECAYTRAECRPWGHDSAGAETRGEVPIAMQPVAHEFGAGHRVRIALAGADAANFEQPPGAAPRWKVHLSASSHVVLPAVDVDS